MDVERLIANAQAEALERPTPDSGHPSEGQLWAYLQGDLDGERRRRIGAHLGSCPDCRAELASLRGALDDLEVLLPPYLSGEALGREADAVRASDGLLQRIEQVLQPLFSPRRWAWHAAAFVVGSTALVGLNGYLHEAFMPDPSPFGSPPPPAWWVEWWAPYVIGAWAGLLALHGVLIGWRRRRDERSNAEESDPN